MAKKKAENSKATVARAAKEDRANAKERASAKAAEDAYWEAAGDGAPKSKSAAKKEQQVRRTRSSFWCLSLHVGDVERQRRTRSHGRRGKRASVERRDEGRWTTTMMVTTTTSIEEKKSLSTHLSLSLSSSSSSSSLFFPLLLLHNQAQERADAAARKAELKRIAEQEDAEAAAKLTAKAKAAKAAAPAARTLRGAGSSAALAALSGASTPPPPTASSSGGGGDHLPPGKVTHHQLRQEAEAEAREREAARQKKIQRAKREVGAEEYEAALDEHGGSHSNRAVGADDVDARSLEAAVAALSVSGAGVEESDDRYPERRARAAFAAYQERELSRLRGDRPGLKLSQYKELVWRSWQKSPENPIFMSGRG